VTTYIAFLRGINLGPNRRLVMADLRGWITELGYTGVRTHIQSGNVVFDSSDKAAEVTRQLEKQLEAKAGFPIGCVVRTPAQLRKVVEANPFPDANDNAKLVVAFLSGPLDRKRLADVAPDAFAPDRFHLAKTEIYLWYPNGIHPSKMPGVLLTDKRLGVSATMRNWNVVTRMLELAEG
jgi:uncharacterized protein (DUF1697 family)